MTKLWVILVIIVAALCSPAQAEILLDRVVAVVNMEVITWSDLYRMMEIDAPPEVKAMGEDQKRKFFKKMEANYLETLIDLRLQVQEAQDLGLRVSDEEVDHTIKSIMEKYSMTETDFIASVKNEGYEFSEYRKRIREKLLVSKVVDRVIRKKIVVFEAETDRFLSDMGTKIDMTDSYHLRQIFLKKPATNPERTALEEKLAQVRGKLKAGKDFGEVAKEFSEDPSAKYGGDIGVIKKSSFSQEFIDVISGLQKGQISDPFWTDRGAHIIQVMESTVSDNSAEKREEAKRILSEKAFSEKYKAWMKLLRENSFIEIRL